MVHQRCNLDRLWFCNGSTSSRPNEGTFAIYTDFSPMADPSFEPGRPGDSAIELGRIVDRDLFIISAFSRDSSLLEKVGMGHSDRLHIIDNGGNLVDAANIAALAALSTFTRPECTFGGEDGQELIVHPPDVREGATSIDNSPSSSGGNIVVIDPSHYEEAVMGGSMTATLNTNGDAGDITSKIKNAFSRMEFIASLSNIIIELYAKSKVTSSFWYGVRRRGKYMVDGLDALRFARSDWDISMDNPHWCLRYSNLDVSFQSSKCIVLYARTANVSWRCKSRSKVIANYEYIAYEKMDGTLANLVGAHMDDERLTNSTKIKILSHEFKRNLDTILMVYHHVLFWNMYDTMLFLKDVIGEFFDGMLDYMEYLARDIVGNEWEVDEA
ncbi:exosome complex component RRP45A [Tanacetum coccineum]